MNTIIYTGNFPLLNTCPKIRIIKSVYDCWIRRICGAVSILLEEKYSFENVLTSLIKFPIFFLSFSVVFMKYLKKNKTA